MWSTTKNLPVAELMLNLFFFLYKLKRIKGVIQQGLAHCKSIIENLMGRNTNPLNSARKQDRAHDYLETFCS
jgi:hypothetical protein